MYNFCSTKCAINKPQGYTIQTVLDRVIFFPHRCLSTALCGSSPILGRFPQSHYCSSPGTLKITFPDHTQGLCGYSLKHSDLWVFPTPNATGSLQTNPDNFYIQLGLLHPKKPDVSQHFLCKAVPPYHMHVHDPASQPLSFTCILYLKYAAKTPRQIC